MPLDAHHIENVRQADENRTKAQEENALNLTEYFQQKVKNEIEPADTVVEKAYSFHGYLAELLRDAIKQHNIELDTIQKEIALFQEKSEQIQEKIASFREKQNSLSGLKKDLEMELGQFEALLNSNVYDRDSNIWTKKGSDIPLTWQEKQEEREYIKNTVQKLKELLKRMDETLRSLEELLKNIPQPEAEE